MSHDRGCPCGKEKYEYDDCTKADCVHKVKAPRSRTLHENVVAAAITKACYNSGIKTYIRDQIISDTLEALYE